MSKRFLSAMSKVMRAIRINEFGGPEVLKVEKDVPIPTPKNTEVLVRVHSAGVNPVDTYKRNGIYPVLPTLPFTPGMDGAGEVVELGENASKFKKGDRVCFTHSLTGSYAEYTTVDESYVLMLKKLSFQQGACIGTPYFTAYRALVQRCRARPAESVLIHGASGAVGIACCQIANSLGLKVLGTAGTQEGMDLVLENGASAAFNHREQGYEQKIMDCTEKKGVDIIIEMLANVNLETDLTLAAKNGRIAIVGSRGAIEVTPRHTMTKELTVLGVNFGLAIKEDMKEPSAYFIAGQEHGWLQPVVGQQYSLERAPEAHIEVIEHTGGTKGKIVLNMDS